MITRKIVAAMSTYLFVAACGGSSPPAVFPIDNPSNSVLSADGAMITLISDNVNVTLPRDDTLDFGPFTGASSDLIEGRRILVSSATTNTYVAMLISPDDAFAVDLFAGRLTPTQNMPTGRAIMEGTFVGATVGGPNNQPSLPIPGNLTLDVNFDDLLLSGTISDRQLETGLNDDSGNPITFSLVDIALLETPIESDGVFLGETAYVRNGEVEDTLNGRYSGAFGNVDGTEVVGQVSIQQRDEQGVIISGEVGIFAAGH